MSFNSDSKGPLPAPVVLGLIILIVVLVGAGAYMKFTQPASGAASAGVVESPVATAAANPAGAAGAQGAAGAPDMVGKPLPNADVKYEQQLQNEKAAVRSGATP